MRLMRLGARLHDPHLLTEKLLSKGKLLRIALDIPPEAFMAIGLQVLLGFGLLLDRWINSNTH